MVALDLTTILCHVFLWKFKLFLKITDLTGNESPLVVSLLDLELNDVELVFTESEIDSDILQFAKTNFDIQNK